MSVARRFATLRLFSDFDRRRKAVGTNPCSLWKAWEKLLRLENPTVLVTSETDRIAVASNSPALRSRTTFSMAIGGWPKVVSKRAANADRLIPAMSASLCTDKGGALEGASESLIGNSSRPKQFGVSIVDLTSKHHDQALLEQRFHKHPRTEPGTRTFCQQHDELVSQTR
jgi:hypothetical protein